ncbi:MAG: (2Fe-2S)-binding protein [Cyclobacteriaceae bacterium]|nr:(2Fe-2S)-binding protein [Cyclobacteriaceae bacterium]
MVKIVIENLGQKELALTDLNKSALQQFQAHFVDWMQSCGGKGRCTSCRMIVLKGGESLGRLSPAEKKYSDQGLLRANERLACQVRIVEDLVIRVPEDSKLPHVTYTP